MRCLTLLLVFTAAFADDDLPIGTNPGSIPSSDKPVAAGTVLRIGQVLQVKWGRTWWAARVVGLKNRRVKITYVGWARSFDEWVTRDRLQLDEDAVKKAKRAVPIIVLPPQLLPPPPLNVRPGRFWRPGSIPSSGQTVSADDQLLSGQLLQVRHGGVWWGAKVVAQRADGSVRIHYVGWEPSWDEWVTRDRLQFDTNPPSIIDRPPS